MQIAFHNQLPLPQGTFPRLSRGCRCALANVGWSRVFSALAQLAAFLKFKDAHIICVEPFASVSAPKALTPRSLCFRQLSSACDFPAAKGREVPPWKMHPAVAHRPITGGLDRSPVDIKKLSVHSGQTPDAPSSGSQHDRSGRELSTSYGARRLYFGAPLQNLWHSLRRRSAGGLSSGDRTPFVHPPLPASSFPPLFRLPHT